LLEGLGVLGTAGVLSVVMDPAALPKFLARDALIVFPSRYYDYFAPGEEQVVEDPCYASTEKVAMREVNLAMQV